MDPHQGGIFKAFLPRVMNAGRTVLLLYNRALRRALQLIKEVDLSGALDPVFCRQFPKIPRRAQHPERKCTWCSIIARFISPPF